MSDNSKIKCEGTGCSFYSACCGNIAFCPKRIINNQLDTLEEREQLIVKMHCGISNKRRFTYAEIAEKFDLSTGRICQLFEEAMATLSNKTLSGISENIIICGKGNDGYAFYYSRLIKAREAKSYFPAQHVDESGYEQIDIKGHHIPKLAIESSNRTIAEKQLLKMIDDWNVSLKLKAKLKQARIRYIIDVFSKPFNILFFNVLQFDYPLLIELVEAIDVMKNNYQIVGKPMSIHSKSNLKIYIQEYIVDYHRRVRGDSTYINMLKSKVKGTLFSALISEMWLNGDIEQYNIGSKYDFSSFWLNTYNRSEYTDNYDSCDRLIESLKNTPNISISLTNIIRQSYYDVLCGVEMKEIGFSHSGRKLKPLNVRIIGDLINCDKHMIENTHWGRMEEIYISQILDLAEQYRYGVAEYTEDIEVELNDDNESYSLIGLGENAWNEEAINIPSVFNGKPINRIKEYAIPSSTWFKSIIIPKTIIDIVPDSFCGIAHFQAIRVREGNPVYHSSGNCLIKTESRELIAGCNTSEIPGNGSVKIIAEQAFQYCDEIKQLIIPDGVERISSGAFHDCTNLTNIIIPMSIVEINEYAFLGCENLHNVFFGGAEKEWKRIDIYKGNEELICAKRYYYSEDKPSEDGFFWHYANNSLTIW